MLTRETRAGRLITFTYDTLNWLSAKAVPAGPIVTYTYTYTYDLANRL